MAIDRDFLAEKVWANSMIPAYGMVPPGIEGYTSADAPTMPTMSQIDREDEAAKILAELGYGPDKPLKMEIRYNTSENHKNTAVAIQEQLKPLGIEVTLLEHRHQDPLRLPRAEGRLRRRPRRLDRRLQGPGIVPRHLGSVERQQLLELQQPGLRAR